MAIRGQTSVEYLVLLAMALIIMLMVTVFVYLWPDYTYSVKKQRSDDYWQNAKPFAVKSHMIVPDQLVLEMENTEPVSLTVTRLYVDGTGLDFYNHSIPFNWSVNDLCGGGNCALAMRPGETQIVSTYNFTSSPVNPCYIGASFSNGLDYEADFNITYYATDAAAPEIQTGKMKLIGKCTQR